jgi:hypothetical protein
MHATCVEKGERAFFFLFFFPAWNWSLGVVAKNKARGKYKIQGELRSWV